MVDWSKLNDEEREFLFKCVLRLHKEKGGLTRFKKKYISKNKFCKRPPFHNDDTVSNILIDAVWGIYGNDNHIRKVNYLIWASLYYLDLIPLLADCKYENLKELCEDIASSEFGYINSEIVDYTTITKDTRDKINAQWKRYKDFTYSGSNYEHLPLD